MSREIVKMWVKIWIDFIIVQFHKIYGPMFAV